MKSWFSSLGHFLVFTYPVLTVVLGLAGGIALKTGNWEILLPASLLLFTGRNFPKVLLLFGLGFGCGYVLLKTVGPPQVPAEKVQLYFKLDEVEKVSAKSIRCKAIGQWQRGEVHRLLLYFPKDFRPELSQFYTTRLRLQRVEGPVLPGTWSYADYLARQNTFLQGFVTSLPQKIIKTEPGFREKYRQRFLSSIENLSIEPRLKHLMQAMVWGDRSRIDPTLLEDFRASGLMHILAISGSHLALLFGILLFVLKWVHHRFRKYKILFALGVLWTFSWLVGLQGSILRACLMLSFYYLAVLLERKPDFLQACFLSMLVILCLDPWQLFDIGFQLSYAAVLGMFFFARPVLKRMDPRGTVRKYTYGLALAGIGAQLGVLPLLLYHFHQVNLLSVFTNLLMVPLGEAVILMGFLHSLMDLVLPQFPFFAYLFEALASLFTKLLSFLGFGLWDRVPFSLPELIFLYAAIVCLLIFAKNLKTRWLVHSGFCVLILLLCSQALNFKESRISSLTPHDYQGRTLILHRQGRSAILYVPESLNLGFLSSRTLPDYALSIRGTAQTKVYPNGAKNLRIGNRVLNLAQPLHRRP